MSFVRGLSFSFGVPCFYLRMETRSKSEFYGFFLIFVAFPELYWISAVFNSTTCDDGIGYGMSRLFSTFIREHFLIQESSHLTSFYRNLFLVPHCSSTRQGSLVSVFFFLVDEIRLERRLYSIRERRDKLISVFFFL